MTDTTRLGTLALALAAVLAIACGKGKSAEQEKNEKKVTVASTNDATQALVDDDYRFRLEWPGTGWKLMREDEIRRMSPDAVAGAMNTDAKVYGAVIVESASDADVQSMAKLIADGRPFEDRVVGEMKPVTLAGATGVRFEMSGRGQGVPIQMDTVVLVHKGYAYQLVAWSVEGVGTVGTDAFFNAFSFTEGEITGRTAASVMTAQGVGWRVTNGVFESAVGGVRVRPNNGFRLTVGDELALTNPDAEVGWTRSKPVEVFGQLIVEPAPGGTSMEPHLAGIRDNFVTAFGATLTGDTKKGTIGGKELTFSLARSTEPVPTSIYYGVLTSGTVLVQVAMWALTAGEAELWSSVEDALGTIEVMTPDEVAVLGRELRATREHRNTITSTSSLRDGVYIDFAAGWSWSAPDGFWRLRSGEEARAVEEGVDLYVEEPALGVYGTMSAAPTSGTAPDEYHRAALSMLGLEATETVASRTASGAEVRSTILDYVEEPAIERSYLVATVTRGDVAVIGTFWGHKSHIHAADFAPVFERITIDPDGLKAVVEEGNSYRDVRMGYAVRVPHQGWRFEDETPSQFAEVGKMVSWSSGTKKFGVITLNTMSLDHDRDWFVDFIEQLFRDEVSNFSGAVPTREDVAIKGHSARHITWASGSDRLEVYIFSRDRMFYAVILVGSNLGIDVSTAFELID